MVYVVLHIRLIVLYRTAVFRVAKAVIDEATKRNVTVLLTERMSESISVLVSLAKQ